MKTAAPNIQLTARLLKALSAPLRVRIVQLLAGRVLCVNALARHLRAAQPVVSQHLRVLREAGLVIPEKRGYFVHYCLDARRLAAARAAVNTLLTPAVTPAVSPSNHGKSVPRKGAAPCPQSPKRVAKNRRT